MEKKRMQMKQFLGIAFFVLRLLLSPITQIIFLFRFKGVRWKASEGTLLPLWARMVNSNNTQFTWTQIYQQWKSLTFNWAEGTVIFAFVNSKLFFWLIYVPNNLIFKTRVPVIHSKWSLVNRKYLHRNKDVMSCNAYTELSSTRADRTQQLNMVRILQAVMYLSMQTFEHLHQ